MKPSLEEERRALLAQIEASRTAYRRMLTGTVAPDSASSTAVFSSTEHASVFPRSRTVRWVMAHPVTVAAGVALLVWVAPRLWEQRKATSLHRPRKDRRRQNDLRDEHQHEHATDRGGNMRALLTAAALLIRDPTTMRNLTRIAGTAWQWLQQQRSKSPRTFHEMK